MNNYNEYNNDIIIYCNSTCNLCFATLTTEVYAWAGETEKLGKSVEAVKTGRAVKSVKVTEIENGLYNQYA